MCANLYKTMQRSTADFAPDAQFAATGYDNRVKQWRHLGIRWKFMNTWFSTVLTWTVNVTCNRDHYKKTQHHPQNRKYIK